MKYLLWVQKFLINISFLINLKPVINFWNKKKTLFALAHFLTNLDKNGFLHIFELLSVMLFLWNICWWDVFKIT